MATTAQLAAINAAINSGATEVTYDGVTTKYRGLAEMRDIRDEMNASLGSPVVKASPFFEFDKGYR